MTNVPYSFSFLRAAAAGAGPDRALAARCRGELRRTQLQSCTRMRCIRRPRTAPCYSRGAPDYFPASPTAASRVDLDALAWHV